MKYKCLVLDHDDTVVKSTPEIHHPSFVEALKTLRPEMESFSLDEFVSYCFDPGFSTLCTDIMRFTKEEQAYQYEVWKSYTKKKAPDFYLGFPEFINEYKEAGGLVCVVSHSEREQILRDYVLHCELVPDLIFGWEADEQMRKPSPYPVLEIMKRFDLSSSDMLVLDDLKPGLDMARSCNIDFAGAGWSHVIPEIESFMREHSDYYFSTVKAFRQFVLQ
jgi:phosphoglycolate phosphatase/pyrophosphatase PpaX